MNRDLWLKLISVLPPGLTVRQVSSIFRRKPQVVERRLRMAGYSYRVTRKNPIVCEWADQVDWSKPNVVLARELGISRERVRQVRLKLKKPFINARGKNRVL